MMALALASKSRREESRATSCGTAPLSTILWIALPSCDRFANEETMEKRICKTKLKTLISYPMAGSVIDKIQAVNALTSG